jgi:hypothetical protein
MLQTGRRSAMREAALALRPQLSQENYLERLREAYRLALRPAASRANG